jgi:hypothetical protein
MFGQDRNPDSDRGVTPSLKECPSLGTEALALPFKVTDVVRPCVEA